MMILRSAANKGWKLFAFAAIVLVFLYTCWELAPQDLMMIDSVIPQSPLSVFFHSREVKQSPDPNTEYDHELIDLQPDGPLASNDKFITNLKICSKDSGGKELPWTKFQSFSGASGFGFVENLYYFNERFYVLTPASTADSVTVERLRWFVHPDRDFAFTIISIRDCDGGKQTPRLAGDFPLAEQRDVSWIALSSPRFGGFLNHYFHFMEFLIGLWAEQWLFWKSTKAPADVSQIKRVIFGPLAPWIAQNQKAITKTILNGLLTYKIDTYDQNNPLPANSLLLFDRAVLVERMATTRYAIASRNANKMNMNQVTNVIAKDPECFQEMKQRILHGLFPQSVGVPVEPSEIEITAVGGDKFKVKVRKPRLTYVSRQNGGRRFSDAVSAQVDELLASPDIQNLFTVQTAFMEKLSPIEQIKLASETDVMLGVHGNGLTHSLWMPKGGVVIEVFVQGTCLRDYQMISVVSGQRWIGLDSKGIQGPGVERFCYCNGTSFQQYMDSISIDTDRDLRNLLITIRNVLDKDPLVA